jgi:hypothetical protein
MGRATRRCPFVAHRPERLPLQPSAGTGVDAFWLLNLHTGRFGPINLQPYYSILLGLFTLVVIASGVGLLLASRGKKPTLASG